MCIQAIKYTCLLVRVVLNFLGCRSTDTSSGNKNKKIPTRPELKKRKRKDESKTSNSHQQKVETNKIGEPMNPQVAHNYAKETRKSPSMKRTGP